MYKRHVKQINNDLKNTRKAIISLGCSFVQGQGAVNDELYSQCEWRYTGLGNALEIHLDENQKKEVLAKYPNVEKGFDGKMDFTFMEYDNAFVNVLCKKYFEGKYTSINLGIRGCGNRATIKELHFNPQLNWDMMDEIIVIYCPSGVERFDFIKDDYTEHFRWKSMWPSPDNAHNAGRKALWEGYAKTLWSEKFGVMEQIGHVQELLTWCKSKNAKLIITPSFDRRYYKQHFKENLSENLNRGYDTKAEEQLTPKHISIQGPHSDVDLLNLFPWDNMFKPQNCETFADLSMSQEKLADLNDHFFQFLGKGSPDKWITPCAHPAAKSHDLFAKLLHEHIGKI